MSSVKHYELIKLNQKNYEIWLYKLKAAFRAEKIAHLISTGSKEKSSTSEQPNWDSHTNNHNDTNNHKCLNCKEAHNSFHRSWSNNGGFVSGWFPKNFVELLNEDSSDVTASSVNESTNVNTSSLTETYVQVLYDWQGTDESDNYESNAEWWTGEISETRQGVFRCTFVRETTEEELIAAGKSTSTPAKDASLTKKPEIVCAIADYIPTGKEQLELKVIDEL